MSVRALSAPAVTLHGARPVRSVPRARRHVPDARSAAWERFNDDRRLIGLKLILIGLLFVMAMVLEVPW